MCHIGLAAVFWDAEGLSKVSCWVSTDSLCVGGVTDFRAEACRPEAFTSPLLDNSCEGL